MGLNNKLLNNTSANKHNQPTARAWPVVNALYSHFKTLFALNPDGLIQKAERLAEDWLGYSAEELIGQSLFSFVHPRQADNLRTMLAAAQAGPGLPGCLKFVRADDSWCQLEINLTYQPEAGQLILQAHQLSGSSDGLARHLIEDHYQRLMETANDLVLVADAYAAIKFVSPSVGQVLGYTTEEIRDKPLFDFIHSDDLARVVSVLGELAQVPGNRAEAAEYRVRHKDGSWLYLEAVGVNRLHDPILQGIVITAHDITHRKEIERALQGQYDYAMHVMNTMGQGLCVADVDAYIEYVNPAYCQMTGYSLEELRRMTAYDLTPPEDYPLIDQARRDRRGNQVTTYQKRILRRDGSIIHVSINGAPRWHNGKFAGSVSVVTDLTERFRQEEEQRRHNQYLNVLNETALDLMNRLETTDLLQAILRRAAALVGTEHGFISLHKSGYQESMRVVAAIGQLKPEQFHHIRPGQGLIGQTWQKGETLLVEDYAGWSEALPSPDYAQIKAAICLPLLTGTHLAGVLGLFRLNEQRSFSPEEVDMLNRFAQMASLALDNARLYSAVQRRVSELTTVQEVARMINSNLQLEEIFRLMVHQISSAFGYDLVSIYLRQGERLVQKAQVGYDVPAFSIGVEEGVSGWVVRTGQTAFVNEASLHPDFIFLTPGVQQAIIIPLKSGKGQILGTLAVESRQTGRLGDDDVSLLTLLADQVSVAIENVHLFSELTQSKEKYREVINSVKEIIYQIDTNGRLIFINPAWEEVMGYTVEESLGRTSRHYIHPDDYPQANQLRLQFISGEVEEYSQELRFVAKDGTVRWLINSSRALKETTEDGRTRIVGISGTLVDVTYRKQAEEERLNLERKMLEAQRLESLGILTGGVAHDFNNLLTAILGNAELAQLQLAQGGPAWLENTFREIETAALYASDLVRQMLAYSGKSQRVVQQVSLNAMAKELTQLFKSSLLKKKINLEYTFDTAISEIEADLSQLRQVIMNLVVNASEAIGENSGGLVRLSTGQLWADSAYLAPVERWLGPGTTLEAGYYVYLEVSDNGCGMNEETLARIFDPFFTTKFTGRGLGLSAVLGIVRGHGGALMVQSQPGQGTTFRVLFPLSESQTAGLPKPGAIPPASANPAASPTPKTILLIDDEEILRTVTTSMLRQLGYEVLTAENGQTGLEIYCQHQSEIALTLLDLLMPGLSGEETLQAIYEVEPAARVILISGYSQQEALGRTLDPGSDPTFLQKPYSLDDLAAKIEKVLRLNAPSA